MEQIQAWFEAILQKPYEYEIWQDADHLEFKTELAVLLVVAPHSGTGHKWMLRASTRSAFDRWANSTAVEEFFDTPQDVCQYLQEHPLELYRKLLCYLSEEYEDLYGSYLEKKVL
jgi:hypothetical protein